MHARVRARARAHTHTHTHTHTMYRKTVLKLRSWPLNTNFKIFELI